MAVVYVEETGGKGPDIDKYTMINFWTYDWFAEARASKRHVTTQTLQQCWMATFSFTSPGFSFKYSEGWVQYFK
jgi:hypothetical protein